MRRDLYPTRTKAGSVLIKRCEPVVWSRSQPPKFISPSEIERFEREGFLVLRGLLSDEEIEAAAAELDRLKKNAENLEPETVVREPDSDAIRSIFRVHRQSQVFGTLSRHKKLIELAEYILDDKIYVMQSRVNKKLAFDGARFDWHSDFETWHAEDGMPGMRALSVSIFLSANSALNGPTMFIPGSHWSFVPCPGETPDENYTTSLRKQQIGVPPAPKIEALAEQGGLTAPSGPPGSIVLFDCNLLHASAPNMTPWPRSNVFFVFNARSNALGVPFDREKPRPEFLAERTPMAA